MDKEDLVAATLLGRKKEQLMRLALAALSHKSSLLDDEADEKSTIAPSDSASIITRATSYLSATPSAVDSASVMDESTYNPHHSVRRLSTLVPRIGIDIGGVLLEADEPLRDNVWEVPGGARVVCEVIASFGLSNVFLVSKVRLGGRMHQRTLQWLREPNSFLERTGLLSENVVFVEGIHGLNGKGVAAARLGLSFFVDDKWEVLESVFMDKAGNSADLVQRFQGILFHFATGGRGRWKPKHPHRMSCAVKQYYHAVSGWSEVLERLAQRAAGHNEKDCLFDNKIEETPSSCETQRQRAQDTKKAFVANAALPSVFVRCVSVGIEEDAAFGVVKRLMGVDGENFEFIRCETGAKLVLNGRGSPHPQPQSWEHEALRICIRAKTRDSLEGARKYVEDLVGNILQEYRTFHEA